MPEQRSDIPSDEGPSGIVDLYSDTATQPTAAMREAMLSAPLGDEQRRTDPTVRALEERIAHVLGKARAVLIPSATMANQIGGVGKYISDGFVHVDVGRKRTWIDP